MSTVPIPIRLQLSTVSGAAPIDANTNLPPGAWRGQAVAVQVAIFDSGNVAVDLSGLVSLTVALQASQDALTPLAAVTVPAADFSSDLTIADWRAGTDQQAEADFTAGQMDQSLDGQESSDLWIVVTGLTAAGQTIIYGAGAFTLVLASESIPFPPPSGLVSYHAQSNAAGNSTVTPASQLHTEAIAVSGTARTSLIILGTANMAAGARVSLRLTGLNAAVAIVLQIVSGISTGPLVTTITTNGTMVRAAVDCIFDGTQWNFALVTTANS